MASVRELDPGFDRLQTPGSRYPLRTRRQSSAIALGSLLMILGVSYLYVSAVWTYTGPANACQTCPAGGCSCNPTHLMQNVPVLTAADAVVLLFGALLPLLSLVSYSGPVRALGYLSSLGVLAATLLIVYLPKQHLVLAGGAKFTDPTYSATALLLPIVVVLGSLLAIWGLPVEGGRYAPRPHPPGTART